MSAGLRGFNAGQVRRNCRVRRQFRTKKFLVPPQTGRNAIEGKYPAIQLPVLPVHMTRRAGVYLSEKVVCQTYHPPNHAWASQLGEPVLGEPSNEVGRATHWASQLGEPVLSGQRLLGATSLCTRGFPNGLYST